MFASVTREQILRQILWIVKTRTANIILKYLTECAIRVGKTKLVMFVCAGQNPPPLSLYHTFNALQCAAANERAARASHISRPTTSGSNARFCVCVFCFRTRARLGAHNHCDYASASCCGCGCGTGFLSLCVRVVEYDGLEFSRQQSHNVRRVG